jgi:hypothetical protein
MTRTEEYLGLLAVLTTNCDPNPTALPAPINPDDVGSHRRLECRFYDRCLDRALERAWRSWTCRACALEAVAADPALAPDHAALARPRAGEAEGLGRRRRGPRSGPLGDFTPDAREAPRCRRSPRR